MGKSFSIFHEYNTWCFPYGTATLPHRIVVVQDNTQHVAFFAKVGVFWHPTVQATRWENTEEYTVYRNGLDELYRGKSRFGALRALVKELISMRATGHTIPVNKISHPV